MKAVNDYIVVDKEKVGPKKIGGLISSYKRSRCSFSRIDLLCVITTM